MAEAAASHAHGGQQTGGNESPEPDEQSQHLGSKEFQVLDPEATVVTALF